MSRFTALLLAGIISGQALYNAGVLGYWLANRQYIAAELCENRNKPSLHCDGKCYLKKKLAAAGNQTPANNATQFPVLKKGLMLAECPLHIAWALPLPIAETQASLPSGDGCCAMGFPKTVFHPPSGLA